MGQVSVFINGRSYRLGCEDGEEHRVHELARYVSAKIDDLTREFGSAGGERLFVMAALLLADEVMELREGLRQAVAQQVDALKAASPEPPVQALHAEPLIPAPRAVEPRPSLQVPGAQRGVQRAQRR